MTPVPIRITGDSAIDWFILGAGALFALYWLRALRLARDGVRRFLGDVAKSSLVFIASVFVMSNNLRLDSSRANGLSFCVAFLAFAMFQGMKRSRRVSAATKRAVIARDFPNGGYDPKLHHIDHVWPHSRGGSNTSDNLRAISKRQNLQKGGRRPRMRDMF